MKDILPNTLKSMGIAKKYNSYSVIIHWEEIAGGEIAAHAWPVTIQRGTMILAVNNSVWSHHLMMLKNELIDKINSFLHEKLVTDIRFQAGYFRKNQNQEYKENGENGQSVSPVRLNANELELIGNMVAYINDEKLRNKIKYVLIKEIATDRAKRLQGWKNCLSCTVLVPPGTSYCTICNLAQKEAKKNAMHQLLIDAPWLTYQETNSYIVCSLKEYHLTKKALVHNLVRRLFQPNVDKVTEASLVMLMTGIKPDKMSQEFIDTMISKIKIKLFEKKVRRKNYVSAPRS
ncbi:MAG TPA: DUF721 domain-containing protein [Methylomusa anaerophila]|nr:DUF721 domain-containing protein [Methylomusa anaerophila]HML88829.1 DUF721 domain-containing protein [Methylomusa anaerophila]